MDLGVHWHLDDSLSIIDPRILGIAKQIELGAWEGTIWNRLAAPETPVDNYRFEIYDRSNTSLSGVVGDGNGTGWADGSTTDDLPMTASAVGILTVGDVMKVESEYVVVESVDRSANTIDVVARGAGGTTGAAHVDTTAFTIIGKAINDTDLKNIESFAETTGKYVNYCQTVAETIDMTFTDDIQARKEFEQKPQLIEEAMYRIFQRLAQSCVLSNKQAPSKASGIPAMTAGILHQLATDGDGNRTRSPLRYNASGVTDPETLLKNALISCWNQGGKPTHIYLSPANKRKFDALTEQFVRMSRDESRVIGTDNGTAYMFQGVQLPFVQDEAMPSDRICIVNERLLYKGWRVGDMLRGPVQEPQNSSRELRYSLQGSFFVAVKGVGTQHIDCHTVSL